MREKMLRVAAPAEARSTWSAPAATPRGSFNISTCAAFIVAGAGVPVAKHGNRALSSRSGAADVLGALGVKIDLTPRGRGPLHRRSRHRLHVRAGASSGDEECRPDPGRARHAHDLQPARPALQSGRRASGRWSACSRANGSSRSPQVLKNLGSERVWVVHGSDGLDEITTSGPTYVAALENGTVRSFRDHAGRRGLQACQAGRAARWRCRRTTRGRCSMCSRARRTPFATSRVLNAAAGLVVAGRADELKKAVALRREVDRFRRGRRPPRPPDRDLEFLRACHGRYSQQDRGLQTRGDRRRQARAPVRGSRGGRQGGPAAARICSRDRAPARGRPLRADRRDQEGQPLAAA